MKVKQYTYTAEKKWNVQQQKLDKNDYKSLIKSHLNKIERNCFGTVK